MICRKNVPPFRDENSPQRPRCQLFQRATVLCKVRHQTKFRDFPGETIFPVAADVPDETSLERLSSARQTDEKRGQVGGGGRAADLPKPAVKNSPPPTWAGSAFEIRRRNSRAIYHGGYHFERYRDENFLKKETVDYVSTITHVLTRRRRNLIRVTPRHNTDITIYQMSHTHFALGVTCGLFFCARNMRLTLFPSLSLYFPAPFSSRPSSPRFPSPPPPL